MCSIFTLYSDTSVTVGRSVHFHGPRTHQAHYRHRIRPLLERPSDQRNGVSNATYSETPRRWAEANESILGNLSLAVAYSIEMTRYVILATGPRHDDQPH